MLQANSLHIGFQQKLFEVEKLSIEPGQLVVLVGANGAGKTSFINTVLGIHKPLKGQLTFDNKSISDYSAKEKLRLFSHVASKFDGLSYLSVKEYVGLGRTPYTNLIHRITNKDEQIITSTLKKVGIQHLENRSTSELSDGERQMASIAKALCQETKMILLDEPTAFLDYPNRLKIMQLLYNIAHEENKIILLTSHELSLSIKYSDVILGIQKRNKKLLPFTNIQNENELIGKVFES